MPEDIGVAQIRGTFIIEGDIKTALGNFPKVKPSFEGLMIFYILSMFS